MPSYAAVWGLLAERATSQGVVDVETFMRMAVLSGMDEQAVMDALEEDLENDGPIFGKFLRGLAGAAQSSVMTALRQGEAMGTIDGNSELRRLVGLAGTEGSLLEAMETANPEMAQALEDEFLDDIPHTSIAELINTCHVCLPLHGVTLTLGEWKARGLLPENRHQGWTSDCHCRLVPVGQAAGRRDLLAPLYRVKLPKPSKKTRRAVAQADIEASMRARDKAMESIEGRRLMRLLGRSGETT